jgi:hypothetical protein
MQRKCESCGTLLPIQTGRGRRRKFCTDCARSPKAKQRRAVLASSESDGLYAAVYAELEAAGVLASADSEAALLLARRIESQVDPGSAIAQLMRALREMKSAALSVADVDAGDPVDEFTAKRREREGA